MPALLMKSNGAIDEISPLDFRRIEYFICSKCDKKIKVIDSSLKVHGNKSTLMSLEITSRGDYNLLCFDCTKNRSQNQEKLDTKHYVIKVGSGMFVTLTQNEISGMPQIKSITADIKKASFFIKKTDADELCVILNQIHGKDLYNVYKAKGNEVNK